LRLLPLAAAAAALAITIGTAAPADAALPAGNAVRGLRHDRRVPRRRADLA